MNANDERKRKQIEKCIFIVRRLRFNLDALKDLGLDGNETTLLQNIYPHIIPTEANLKALLLEREIEPPKQKEKRKAQRSIKL